MDMQRVLGIGGPAVIIAVLAIAFAGMLGGSATPTAVQTGNVVNSPPSSAGPVKTVQLGLKDFAFYFPETASDLLTVKPGEAIRFEMLLDGPNQLTGCMKSVKMPAQFGGALKVAKPGDNYLQFTAPQTTGDYSFTCGMGMGVGRIRVSL